MQKISRQFTVVLKELLNVGGTSGEEINRDSGCSNLGFTAAADIYLIFLPFS